MRATGRAPQSSESTPGAAPARSTWRIRRTSVIASSCSCTLWPDRMIRSDADQAPTRSRAGRCRRPACPGGSRGGDLFRRVQVDTELWRVQQKKRRLGHHTDSSAEAAIARLESVTEPRRRNHRGDTGACGVRRRGHAGPRAFRAGEQRRQVVSLRGRLVAPGGCPLWVGSGHSMTTRMP